MFTLSVTVCRGLTTEEKPGEREEKDKGRRRKACLISVWLHANLFHKLAVKSIPETSLRREFLPLRRLSSWPARPSRSTFISAWERQCRPFFLPAVFSVLWRALIIPEPTPRLAQLPTIDRSQRAQSEPERRSHSFQPTGHTTFLMSVCI